MDGLHINTELKSRAEQDERTDPQKQPEKPPCQATLAGAEKKKDFEQRKNQTGHLTMESHKSQYRPGSTGLGDQVQRSTLVEPRPKRGTARHEKNRV
jgi:hypothetical protein